VSVVCVCNRCNIIISGKIIIEMPSSVASGTPCICRSTCTLRFAIARAVVLGPILRYILWCYDLEKFSTSVICNVPSMNLIFIVLYIVVLFL